MKDNGDGLGADPIEATPGPVVGIFCDEADRAALVTQAEEAHYRTIILPSDAPISVALVSSDVPGHRDIVRKFAGRARVVVYGEAVDDLEHMALKALGASAVVTRRAVLDDLACVLPRLT